jgi:hypothetical protein
MSYFVGKYEIVNVNTFTVTFRQSIWALPPPPHPNQSNNDLRSPKFVRAQYAQLYSLAETPQRNRSLPSQPLSPPAFGLIYEGAIGQPR